MIALEITINSLINFSSVTKVIGGSGNTKVVIRRKKSDVLMFSETFDEVIPKHQTLKVLIRLKLSEFTNLMMKKADVS